VIDGASGRRVELDDFLRAKLAEYGRFLASIGQEQVLEIVATTLARLKLRQAGSIVCRY
jgi:hypothetical protein